MNNIILKEKFDFRSFSVTLNFGQGLTTTEGKFQVYLSQIKLSKLVLEQQKGLNWYEYW